VNVQVVVPDAGSAIAPCRVDGLFTVSYSATSVGGESIRAHVDNADWSSAFTDAAVRRVFVHLGEHGAVTETEITKMLGSSRAFRSFSLKFEQHVRLLPFRVRIDTGAGEKRYLKDGDV
jgi:hypothetical protein